MEVGRIDEGEKIGAEGISCVDREVAHLKEERR